MLGDSPQVFGFGTASSVRRFGAPYMFDLVRPVFARADLVIGNLEVAVAPTPRDATFGERIYRGVPEAVVAMAGAGIDVVSVCTNHMMQHGPDAFDACVGALQGAGIIASGADWPARDLRRTVSLTRQGRRITILSYNFRPVQYTSAPPAWPTPSEALILEDIRQAKAATDLVLVTLHWGDEFIEYPSPDQIVIAHALVDGGADVIIGHHPHIVQGVERYKGAVIAYSLGNFVYDQWQPELRRSMILMLDVHGDREIDYTIEPVIIDGHHRPVPCDGSQRTHESTVHEALASLIGRQSNEEYRRTLDARYAQFRRDVMVHYATRFWKFRPRDLVANIEEIIRRRL
jgi:poly-gamma-glutamate synthesis protein (capsule biosynthesis protein)